jgi:hypothetical protein
MGERASAPNRLIGQDRFGAVLFSSTDNRSGEDIGKRCATREDLPLRSRFGAGRIQVDGLPTRTLARPAVTNPVSGRRPREIRGRRERDVIFRDCQDIWEVSRQLRDQPEPARSLEPPVGASASTELIESARL